VYPLEHRSTRACFSNGAALVKFLLERGADVRARAWGSFFKDGFYGEYPLSFAVRVNNQQILDYFLQRSDRGRPRAHEQIHKFMQNTKNTENIIIIERE
jgi:ankyrin repeat protein